MVQLFNFFILFGEYASLLSYDVSTLCLFWKSKFLKWLCLYAFGKIVVSCWSMSNLHREKHLGVFDGKKTYAL